HNLFFSLMLSPHPRSTLFPYTTLFRSVGNFQRIIIRNSFRHEFMFQKQMLDEELLFIFPCFLIKPEFILRNAIKDTVLAVIGKLDRKSTRLNSSHVAISYAVFCLKKKK